MNKSRKIFILLLIPLIVLMCCSFWVKKEQAVMYLSNNSIFDDIRFSVYDEATAVFLHEDTDNNMYHAYMPANSNSTLNVYFNYCTGIVFDGLDLSNGGALPDITPEVPYLIQAYDWNHNIFEEGYVVFYFSESLPSMHITTENGDMDIIHSDKEHSETASYIIYTANGIMDSMGGCSIKGRGNSSWGFEQKPYSINLANTVSLLNMEASSDWALLSNYDNNLPQLKTKITFELAEKMGLPYTPQSEFVNLYLNGEYYGLYLLSQRINANSFEYLVEFDARYKDEPVHFATEHQRVVVKAPSMANDTQKNHVYNYLLNAESSLYNENGINSITNKSYYEYFDITSWADIYSIHNFFCQWDVEYASFYLYKLKNNPFLYAGPVWDFDNSCGKMHVGYYPKLASHMLWLEDGRGEWLSALSKQDNFPETFRKRHLEVLSPAMTELLRTDYKNITQPLSASVKMDSLRWDKNIKTAESEISNLYNWLVERQSFLDDYYENPNTYCKVTFEFPWGSAIHYVKENTPLGFLPLERDGETSKNENLYGFEEIIGWRDNAGNEIESSILITEDTTFFAIYK